MKYSTVIVALAAGFASAAPAGENVDKRGFSAACLALCAPLAPTPIWAGYAACLAACVAAGVEGEPVEADEFIKKFAEEQEKAAAQV